MAICDICGTRLSLGGGKMYVTEQGAGISVCSDCYSNLRAAEKQDKNAIDRLMSHAETMPSSLRESLERQRNMQDHATGCTDDNVAGNSAVASDKTVVTASINKGAALNTESAVGSLNSALHNSLDSRNIQQIADDVHFIKNVVLAYVVLTIIGALFIALSIASIG